jgi:hypothetical protein
MARRQEIPMAVRKARPIALTHFIVSSFALYMLVALEIPKRPPTSATTFFGIVWGVLNPPIYLVRWGMEIVSGLSLAFFVVFALQVVFSYGLYVVLVWWFHRQEAARNLAS